MANKSVFDPNTHHRRSIRLKEFDYTQPGIYFITICTYQRKSTLGNIIDDQMALSEFGKIIVSEWLFLPVRFPHISLDQWVVMPNHLHGIIQINYVQKNVSPISVDKPGSRPGSINAVIQNFKSITTRKINSLRNQKGNPFWQRNYYEHVVRNEQSLAEIREYVVNNPFRWKIDKLYIA